MMRWVNGCFAFTRPGPAVAVGLALSLAASLAACAGAYHTPSDGRLTTRINGAYAARDACLSRNATMDAALSLQAEAAAQAASLACVPETEKLVEIVNRDGDPRVAERIRRDSEFRALGFVLRARGEVTN